MLLRKETWIVLFLQMQTQKLLPCLRFSISSCPGQVTKPLVFMLITMQTALALSCPVQHLLVMLRKLLLLKQAEMKASSSTTRGIQMRRRRCLPPWFAVQLVFYLEG